ncbi:class II aldolase/adducin family protein [Clostridium sp. JN-9]|uniref:class II aldolase/adducin family protein n=1 Tax=Clostridium sp. JN-9 TaxID=2507159 RepID=UPI000FFE18BD|nr:class II aldolase/adducin family protein [Clostridium sp. JN-9]QAT39112.1 class II aldolase/adducin family protein [Clostridium sp. JN-9]
MLENLKKQVVAVAQEADRKGLCKHGSGNFSIRDKETGYVLVTPTGVPREELTYHDICVVDMNGNVIEIETDVKPTSEVFMHLEAYKCRPEVISVVHTHSRFATTFAVLNKEIPPMVYEAMVYGGVVKVAPYGRPGTKELAESIIEPLKHGDACLLEQHGVVTVDSSDIKKALLKAFYVEEVAEIYYGALVINGGKEPKVIPASEFTAWKYPKDVKINK